MLRSLKRYCLPTKLVMLWACIFIIYQGFLIAMPLPDGRLYWFLSGVTLSGLILSLVHETLRSQLRNNKCAMSSVYNPNDADKNENT